MNQVERWGIYFQYHKYPCFVTETNTKKILYYNEVFKETFEISGEILGKVFSEVVLPEDVQIQKPMPDWTKQDSYESLSYNKRLNKNFLMRAVLTEDGTGVFCELLPTEHELQGVLDFEHAMTRCMEICAHSDGSVVIHFLELLAKFYESERAYVYRINREDSTINCIAQWCVDPKFLVTQELGAKLDARFLIEWVAESHEAGIVTLDGERPDFQRDSMLGKMLSTFQVKNMVLATVENADKELVGVVGVSNLKSFQGFLDRRLLNTISRFVAQDVAKRVVDVKLFQLQHRDTLTGLYNRTGYATRVEEILEVSPKCMGVISANINGLKYINEHGGIAVGDEHIRKSAQRLKKHFGFEIFRMSGDEFVGLAADMEREVFENLVRELHEEMSRQENYDFSFGHSWCRGKIDLSKLQFEAETVMYINKQEYYFHTNRHFDCVKDSTLSDLLYSLEQGEFMVYLQPQVQLADGSLYGAEALIRRFDKKNQKMVFPDEFIPLYEQKSVIRHVDMFVVEFVCKLLQDWGKMGKAIPISVNLSRVTLQEYGIVKNIVDICDRYHVPHHYLVIEVTERVGLIENNVANTLIQEFKEQGFHISLDDFGCAYSNIVTLAQIDVDEVKIDKSLVDYILTSKKNRVLVKNVLSMCNEMDGSSTLAEGIECREQAEILHNMGCRLGQGYLYSRPIPVPDFIEHYIQEI